MRDLLHNCFLNPGELLVSRHRCQVTTILGTCVAVCLFDPHTEIGGMNHYMLPAWTGRGKPSTRYGDIAIARLIASMVEAGAAGHRMVAKVFGGADVTGSAFKIGYKNATMAVHFLKQRNIGIVEEDVGGNIGRKIKFSTWNHRVTVDYLSNYGK